MHSPNGEKAEGIQMRAAAGITGTNGLRELTVLLGQFSS
jgi:hypothetical protein